MIINGDGGYGLLAAYIGGPAALAGWLGAKVGGHLAPFLYSSCEPSELSQWLCYDDSTIHIVVAIIIIIIIIIIIKYECTMDQELADTATHAPTDAVCALTKWQHFSA